MWWFYLGLLILTVAGILVFVVKRQKPKRRPIMQGLPEQHRGRYWDSEKAVVVVYAETPKEAEQTATSLEDYDVDVIVHTRPGAKVHSRFIVKETPNGQALPSVSDCVIGTTQRVVLFMANGAVALRDPTPLMDKTRVWQNDQASVFRFGVSYWSNGSNGTGALLDVFVLDKSDRKTCARMLKEESEDPNGDWFTAVFDTPEQFPKPYLLGKQAKPFCGTQRVLVDDRTPYFVVAGPSGGACTLPEKPWHIQSPNGDLVRYNMQAGWYYRSGESRPYN